MSKRDQTSNNWASLIGKCVCEPRVQVSAAPTIAPPEPQVS